MPNVQPNYFQYLTDAVAGQLAEFELHNVISRECQNTSGIAFGAVVVRGTGDHQVQQAGVSGASSAYLGIALVDPTVRAEENNQYQQYDTVAVLTVGVVWVVNAVSVTPGQSAYFDVDGNITNLANATFTAATSVAQGAAGNTITFSAANAADILVGATAVGTDIPANTTVTAVNTGTGVVTLSAATSGIQGAATSVTFTSPNTAIPGGVFDNTASAASLVKLRLN